MIGGPNDPPTVDWGQLRALMDTLPKGRVAARIEVGEGVLDRLRKASPAAPKDFTIAPTPMDLLTGLPVVELDGLEPGEWRLVDADGMPIRSGRLHAPARRSVLARAMGRLSAWLAAWMRRRYRS